ncbi:DUF1236 domain-containing protein [Rhodobacteraceae bacterium CCMM004]|nr:DUF1236 domain-containing protein [Rhodobacteraceae bacterium CCMM004]
MSVMRSEPMKRSVAMGVAALILSSGVASAEMMAVASTDLTVRSGPGSNYDAVTTIPTWAEAEVEGCLVDTDWCKVGYGGVEGWAWGGYLVNSQADPEPIVALDTRTVAVVVADDAMPVSATTGRLLAPVDTVAVEPSPAIRAFVEGNPLPPLFLDGEVMLGVGIPEGVTLYPVPDSDLTYLYLNNELALIDPGTRRIVGILR